MGDDEEEYKVLYKGEDEPTAWLPRAGRCKITYPNGDTYDGDIDERKLKHGKGRYEWNVKAAGDEDEGDDDEAKQRQVYDGQWCDGLRHGVGTMVYPTMDPKTKRSDSYSGQWVKGLREGRGAYRYVNGDIYSGSWKAGKKEGQGTYVYANDVQLVGTWQNGQIVSGKWVFKDTTTFTGEFDGNLPLGPGKFEFFNGNKQAGEYIKTGLDDTLSWSGEPIPL